jgi:hypothetical protein
MSGLCDIISLPRSREATVTDKEVERNVRSTTVEGIQTPTQRHVQGIGEQHAVSFGEKSQARKTRESLLEKFRLREARKKGGAGERSAEVEESEPGEGGGEAPAE